MLYGIGGYNQYNTTIPTDGIGSQYDDLQKRISGLYSANAPKLGDMFMPADMRKRMSGQQTDEFNRREADAARQQNWSNAGQMQGQLDQSNRQMQQQQIGQASQMQNAYNNMMTGAQAQNWQNQMHAMQGAMGNIAQRIGMFQPFLSQAFTGLSGWSA